MAPIPREQHWPVLRFDDIPVPAGRLSLRAYAGDRVQLQGAGEVALLRLLGIACGHAFGGPGRCRIDDEDTRALDAAGRAALRARCVGRALLFDTLPPEMPLVLAVAQGALRQGVPAPAAVHRASVELDVMALASCATRPAAALSAGERRLALVARALACRPQLLVLEQPDRDLDPAQRATLRRAIVAAAEHGTCVLFSAGHPSLAAVATHHVRVSRPMAVPA